MTLGLDGFAGLGDRWWWYLHIAMQGGAYRGSLSKSGTDWADFSDFWRWFLGTVLHDEIKAKEIAIRQNKFELAMAKVIRLII